uniref:ATP synthase complex subunit 8 n=1 Tax=Brentidae sp. KM-2017 TaxID=2219284 RepID=A0A346RFN1_9CUCU|nr:ATP synthase F0 subunit 8 [Brentidae sp. KM-2017]
MPQMAPLNWLFLFIIFMMTFIMFNIMNYFSFFYLPKIYFLNKTLIQLNWKW